MCFADVGKVFTCLLLGVAAPAVVFIIIKAVMCENQQFESIHQQRSLTTEKEEEEGEVAGEGRVWRVLSRPDSSLLARTYWCLSLLTTLLFIICAAVAEDSSREKGLEERLDAGEESSNSAELLQLVCVGLATAEFIVR